MEHSYACIMPETGADDLGLFRDAVITYSACRRARASLRIDASPEAAELLGWLGVEGVTGEVYGRSYLDAGRQAPVAVEVVKPLPRWEVKAPSLESFRRQGYLAETMFAALVRSSYGPEGPDFFPTRSELGFYFDERLLLDEVRWDQDYLRDCQAFFLEELMPAELVAKSLDAVIPDKQVRLRELSDRFEEELHGVTFLVASELVTLSPLAVLIEALLTPGPATARWGDWLAALQPWDRSSWAAAWADLSEEQRQAAAAELCPGFTDRAEALLFTAGPRLLGWRAATAVEALP